MLDESGRPEFIAEAAEGDEAVREGVSALLEAHGSADEFFEELVAGIRLADPEDAAGEPEQGVAGRRIGPYQLTRLLGRGGMGAVYLAEQVDGQIKRTVALKLLPIGLDNEDSRRWFQAERQVLSRLSHPGIARLYQADVADDGTPYFVMEFVDGKPLLAYCDENQLSIRDRIELLLKVLDAVQSAHERLIVHRDLKPSNILVGDDEEPKLLDFGVARVLDPHDPWARATLTAKGVPHTPDYASPEQALGDPVTASSDVYSLGVVLYELLTGALPFQPGLHAAKRLVSTPATPAARFEEFAETQITVAHQRGASPAVLQRLLRGDIGWIAIKALDSDPTKRYTSASALAAELRRYLNGEPVDARAPSTLYRTVKFVRRNRVGVSIAASVVLGLSAFSAVTAVQANRIAEERDRAELEAAKASAFREVVTAPNPMGGSDAAITVVEALDRGAGQIDAFGYTPEVTAAVRAAIASAYLDVGKIEEAGVMSRLALSELEPGSSADPDRAEALLVLGELYRYAAKPDSAEAVLRAALDIRHDLFGADDVRVGEVYQALGAARRDGDQYAEAEVLLDSAVVIYERAGDDRRVAAALGELTELKWFLDSHSKCNNSAKPLRQRS